MATCAALTTAEPLTPASCATSQLATRYACFGLAQLRASQHIATGKASNNTFIMSTEDDDDDAETEDADAIETDDEFNRNAANYMRRS